MVATANSVATSPAQLAPRVQPAAVSRPASRPVAQFLQPEPGREFYFGFGANLAPRVVQSRNLAPKSEIPATLHNYKLYFNHVGGYASIEYRPGDTTRPDVHGVVLDLSQEEMKLLANTEQGYDVASVVVTGAGGERYAAKAFTSNWSVRLFQETIPTQDYIGKLQEGSQIHQLPAQYQAWLQGIEGRSSIVPSEDEEVLASPASYLAMGFSAALVLGAFMIFVGPPRR